VRCLRQANKLICLSAGRFISAGICSSTGVREWPHPLPKFVVDVARLVVLRANATVERSISAVNGMMTPIFSPVAFFRWLVSRSTLIHRRERFERFLPLGSLFASVILRLVVGCDHGLAVQTLLGRPPRNPLKFGSEERKCVLWDARAPLYCRYQRAACDRWPAGHRLALDPKNQLAVR
jgi:hypothetical protein